MNKKICAKCGCQTDENATFCMYCGSNEFKEVGPTSVLGEVKDEKSDATSVLGQEVKEGTTVLGGQPSFVSSQQPAPQPASQQTPQFVPQPTPQPVNNSNQGVYYQPQQSQQNGGYYQAPGGQAQNGQSPFPQYQQPQVEDNPSMGLRVLSWFIPLVGIILYFTKKDKTPKSAKSYLTASLISIGVNVAISILFTIIGIVVGFSASDDYDYDDSSYSDDYLFEEDYDFDLEDDYTYDEPVVEYTPGTFDGTTYTNEWADLYLTVPEGYYEGTAEEYAVFEDEITDCGMYVKNDDGFLIVVATEELSVYNSDMTAQDYIDLELDEMADEYTTLITANDSVYIGSNRYNAAHFNWQVYESYSVVQSFYIRRIDNRMLAVIVMGESQSANNTLVQSMIF